MSALAEELEAVVRKVLREELARLISGLPSPAGERLLDVDETARRLGLSSSTIYKRANACELPSVKLGGRVLFKPADLDAYAEERRRSPERVKELASRGGAG